MDVNENQNGTKETKMQCKLPFRRLKLPLDQLVNTAIPLHIDLLNKQSESIEELKGKNHPLQLRQEQLKASKAVHLLKADLYEIEQLNVKVREEDQEIFARTIEKALKEAVEALSNFMVSHSDVLGPFLDVEEEINNQPPQFPKLICDETKSTDDFSDENGLEQAYLTSIDPIASEQAPVAQSWAFLRRQILEIHSLIRQFSSIVLRQQDSIDSLQSNIIQTHENVREGTQHLKRASVLRAASFPLAGAVIGGIVLGPFGALAGFKLLGSVACVAGGSVIGYSAGKKLKKTQEKVCDMEMKALTYPSKPTSSSSPDLTILPDPEEKS